MLTRIITALVGIPIVIAVVLVGNPLLKYVMLIVSLIALYEMYHAMRKDYHPIKVLGYLGIGVYFIFYPLTERYAALFLAILLILTLSYMVICYPKYTIIDIALTFFPVIYIGLLFGFFTGIRAFENGAFWMGLIAVASWGCDTCAYFTGMAIGKHKLAPVLSPKKTIEGSIGGVIGAGLLSYLYTSVCTHYMDTNLQKYTLFIVAVSMVASVISQFGDLSASAIKRYFKEKDFGHLLPGHGGILDRFDSILFVSPVIYWAVLLADYVIQ